MIVGLIVEFSVAALCIVLGLVLWLKQKISLLHDYHYQHVKKEDIPAYTRQMGIGIILIGAGIGLDGLFTALDSPYWWVPMTAGIVLGSVVMVRAQKKYNGSIMG
ncbi:MAG: DUF3784 domain-containing protein [Oscillospiraceae bacterium]|nr:DUF3784 domain-containing protein [Oscillospiraceae bacterium]